MINSENMKEENDGGIKVMKRTASDNKYLHRDFHQTLNLLMDYIYENFGINNLITYLEQFTLEYHKSLHDQLKEGNINALVSYFHDMYEKEEWPVIIKQGEGYVEIEQETPCPLYVETYRTVYSTLCSDTPFEYKLDYFDDETGACKQTFRKKGQI
jgi:hypothetical protein